MANPPIQGRLVDLALGPVLVDEPVVTNGLRVFLSRQPHDLGRLRFESLQSTWPDLQLSVQFQIAHDSSPSLSSSAVVLTAGG
jgi:hypothetical protein